MNAYLSKTEVKDLTLDELEGFIINVLIKYENKK